MRQRILIVLILLLLASPGFSAITLTEVTHGSVKLIVATWTSDATGDATVTTSNYYYGKLIWFVTDPGGTAPSDNYDIVVTDRNSQDVLATGGANRDTTNTEYVAEASLGAVVASKLTITISNAGDSKIGVLYIYIR